MADSDVIVRRTDLLREVRKADADFDRDAKRPVVYRMTNKREFREKEGKAYEDE